MQKVLDTLDCVELRPATPERLNSPPRIEPLARTGSWLCRAYNTGPHVLISFARLLHSHRLWSKVQANLKHLKIK